MTLSYRDGIAILQIIVFVPCLNLALYLCFKQGLRAVASCWRFLVVLAALRIAGAVCQLLLAKDHSDAVVTTKIVCDLLGIAPLTLACVGLLQRVNASADKVSKYIFTLVSLISLVGLALGIAGALKSVTAASLTITALLQAALGLFIACLGLMLGILVFLSFFMRILPRSEKIILYAVYTCAPFLLVRMAYAAIADYASIPSFKLFTGSPTVALVMGALPEIVVMVVCLGVGFRCPPPRPAKKDIEST